MGSVLRLRSCLVVALASAGMMLVDARDAGAQQSRRPRPQATDAAALEAAMPQPTTCSRAYSSALAGLAPAARRAFDHARATLRAPIPGLAARWHFNPPRQPLDWTAPAIAGLAGREQAGTPDTRWCAGLVLTTGGAACRLGARRAGPPPALQASAAAGDGRLQRLLEVYRQAGGVAPEFRPEGRFYWTIERVAQDLAAYVDQKESASICSGVPEMLDFLGEQIAQPTRRSAAIKEVARSAGDAAMRALATLGERVALPTDATIDADAMLGLVAAALLLKLDAPITTPSSIDERLRLVAVAVRRLPAGDAEVARGVLAPIEIFAFAAQMAARYGTYDHAYPETLTALRAAHATHCTCPEG